MKLYCLTLFFCVCAFVGVSYSQDTAGEDLAADRGLISNIVNIKVEPQEIFQDHTRSLDILCEAQPESDDQNELESISVYFYSDQRSELLEKINRRGETKIKDPRFLVTSTFKPGEIGSVHIVIETPSADESGVYFCETEYRSPESRSTQLFEDEVAVSFVSLHETIQQRLGEVEGNQLIQKESLDHIESTVAANRALIQSTLDVINAEVGEVEDSIYGKTIQRRETGSVDFYRGWADYVNGFGDPDGDFWLGLKEMAELTKNGAKLIIILTREDGTTAYAQYSYFRVEGPEKNYRLTIGGHSGSLEDDLASHNRMEFTTYDNDNDRNEQNCAKHYRGAWWYNSCHSVNLNGLFHDQGYAQGINWQSFTGFTDSAVYSEMIVIL